MRQRPLFSFLNPSSTLSSSQTDINKLWCCYRSYRPCLYLLVSSTSLRPLSTVTPPLATMSYMLSTKGGSRKNGFLSRSGSGAPRSTASRSRSGGGSSSNRISTGGMGGQIQKQRPPQQKHKQRVAPPNQQQQQQPAQTQGLISMEEGT